MLKDIGENYKGQVIGESIRLLLIDTLESVHSIDPIEVFGVELIDYVKEYYKHIDTVVLELEVDERDKYDRLLAYV